MKLRTLVVLLGLAALIAGGIAYKIWFAQTPAAPSAGTRGTRGSGDGPLPVLAVRAERTDVPVELDGIGTVQALNTVTIRPQVDGRLISLHFKDGDPVKTGDILAKIDPKTYQAALDQALAKKAQDEAQLANARRDLERYTNMPPSNRPIRSALLSPSWSRRSMPIRPPSTMPKPSSITPSSAHPLMAALGCGWSIRAICCAPRTRPA
jgi:multidrug efflux system membrane fusion protein